MVYSMTGYGRAEKKNDAARFVVEMRSVNHRFSEIAIRMPRELAALEDQVRKCVLRHIRRGRVDVFVTMQLTAPCSALEVNWDLALQYKKTAEQLASMLGESEPLSVKDMMLFPDVVRVVDEDVDVALYSALLLEAAEESALLLAQMREKEGQALRHDILNRLDEMKAVAEQISRFVPEVASNYRERIVSRLQEYIEGRCELDEARLLNEVALFAERADISEELTRLHSHLTQFAHIVEEKEPIGRKLDFLVQECHREVNTMGAKANHLEISRRVVLLKAELEKVKEQVQNIE